MNKFNKILLFIFSVLLLPMSCLLTGCGATPSKQAQGVTFLSDIQNEKGQAVFELDLGAKLKLPYKINPSSAYGYAPRFTAVSGISGDNLETYFMDMATGEFCINRLDFKDVEVQITVGSFTDVCQIKLKKYPTEIGIYDENEFNQINKSPKINLACGESYQINVAAIMADSQIIDEDTGEKLSKLLLDNDYNFLVECDENSKTIINIPNKNRLSFMAYDNYGTAKVKVAICDYFNNVIVDAEGNAVLAFEIEVNVYKPCETTDILIAGANKIVSSDSVDKKIKIDTSQLIYDEEKDCFISNFSALFYDEFDRQIEDENLYVNGYVDKQIYVSIDNMNKNIYIHKPVGNQLLSFSIKFWTNASLKTGEYSMLDVQIEVNF